MNERIAKLYDQAIVLKGNGDYVAGELDPEKFAELIIQECMSYLEQDGDIDFAKFMIKQNFGVEL